MRRLADCTSKEPTGCAIGLLRVDGTPRMPMLQILFVLVRAIHRALLVYLESPEVLGRFLVAQVQDAAQRTLT